MDARGKSEWERLAERVLEQSGTASPDGHDNGARINRQNTQKKRAPRASLAVDLD